MTHVTLDTRARLCFTGGMTHHTTPAPAPAERAYPTTSAGRGYRTMAYWYAAGFQDAQPDAAYFDGSEFARWAGLKADEYTLGQVSHLASVPDMFKQWLVEQQWPTAIVAEGDAALPDRTVD